MSMQPSEKAADQTFNSTSINAQSGVAVAQGLAEKAYAIYKFTGAGKTFTITFPDGVTGTNANVFMFGRFGYDSAKLSAAIINHNAANVATIKCFGDETATVSCSGQVVTVTTQNAYAGVTLISHFKIT